MENEPIEYPDDTGKINGWRKEDRWTSGKFRKRQNAQAHITVIYVRISRSDESVDGLLLWRKRKRKRERGKKRMDILYRIKIEGTKDHGPLCRRS